jgi:hypothetical protein
MQYVFMVLGMGLSRQMAMILNRQQFNVLKSRSSMERRPLRTVL